MQGKPVLIERLCTESKPAWFVMAGATKTGKDAVLMGTFLTYLPFDKYWKTWLAYAYQPAHIDQKACMMCKSPSALNRFLEMSCRYCPKCGRPLTPEALAELKHRMGVCI